jgi:hypothetical protein
MPYNLLLLPLLGGYLFLRWWNPTRYHALRAEKERLLILAAIPGLASLIIAFAIVKGLGAILPCTDWPNVPCFPAWWKANIPFDYLGTSLLAFGLGASVWKPWNYFFCEQKVAIDKVIDEDKIPFELLLKKAQDQTKTVSVTMSNGKVYVGWVTHLFNPALPTNYIQILPVKSGYRDEDTKWVVFTTYYSQAIDNLRKAIDAKAEEHSLATKELEELTAKNEKEKTTDIKQQIEHLKDHLEHLELEYYEMEETAEDFDIVLPCSEIMSLNIFSEYVHSEHFAPAPEGENEETADTSGSEMTYQQKLNQLRNLSEEERLEVYRKVLESSETGVEPDIFSKPPPKPKTD